MRPTLPRRRAPPYAAVRVQVPGRATYPSLVGDDDFDDEAMARRNEEHGRAYAELWRWAPGQEVIEVERRMREFTRAYAPYAREVDVVIQSRVMTDPRWGIKHPVSALALAWRFRSERPPRSTLRLFIRPRLAG